MRLVHDDPDDDGDEDTGGYGEDDDTTSPCPYCGRSIYDDAEWCPSCGKYLSREDVRGGRPWWFVAGVIVCLVVILGWVVV